MVGNGGCGEVEASGEVVSLIRPWLTRPKPYREVSPNTDNASASVPDVCAVIVLYPYGGTFSIFSGISGVLRFGLSL